MPPRFAPLRPASLRGRLKRAAASMAACAAPSLAAAAPVASQAHFFTDNYSERQSLLASGYWLDYHISCYVYPGGTAGTVPLYEAYYPPTGQYLYTTSYAEWHGLGSPWQQDGVRAYVLPAY